MPFVIIIIIDIVIPLVSINYVIAGDVAAVCVCVFVCCCVIDERKSFTLRPTSNLIARNHDDVQRNVTDAHFSLSRSLSRS